MPVDQQGTFAHIQPTAQVLGLGEHGRHTVDTTMLTGALVTLVVQLRDLAIPASTIIGLAHELDHQVVLRAGRGHATVATIAEVRAALRSIPARALFDLEHEALCLRDKLSNPYASQRRLESMDIVIVRDTRTHDIRRPYLSHDSFRIS